MILQTTDFSKPKEFYARETVIECLTTDQIAAFDGIIESVNKNINCSLVGYAGTGKSYLCSKIIQYYNILGINPIVTAPTNKAVKVLQSMGASTAITIHKLLGLVLLRGKLKQVGKPNVSKSKNGLVIVDECSMVGTELYTMIYSSLNCPVLFVGDPAQLPPVQEKGISKTFDQPNTFKLTEIVRQAAGNPIIQFSMAIRNGDFDSNNIPVDDKHIFAMQSGNYTKFARQVYEQGGITAGWTNNYVDLINLAVHKDIYGACSTEYEIGEEFVLAQPIKDSFDSTIKGTVGDRYIVSRIESGWVDGFGNNKHNKSDFQEGLVLYPIWYIYSDTLEIPYIVTLKNEAIEPFQKRVSELFAKAKALPEYDRQGRAVIYDQAWKMVESKTDIKHCYASTCHKLQGSTYDLALINVADIMRNRDREEALKCLYVAVTRARNKICLVK
jgi:exodeoxyribonuclease V